MIIFEGPNRRLRTELRHLLQAKLGPGNANYHISGMRPDILPKLVRMLHTDNRLDIRDGFPVDPPRGHGLRHMIASALQATGSVLVVCLDDADTILNDELRDRHELVRGAIPVIYATEETYRDQFVKDLIELWQDELAEVSRTFEFNHGGRATFSPVMVVGERLSPFLPIEQGRRVAFIHHEGCAPFLHMTLLAAPGKYYLTNAIKADRHTTDLHLLGQEILRVEPRLIVAMGTHAGRALSDLRVRFHQTYHPNYWKRFKHKDCHELVKLFRSANQQPTL